MQKEDPKKLSSYAIFQQNVLNFLHLPFSYLVEWRSSLDDQWEYHLDLTPFKGGSISVKPPNQKWLRETLEMLNDRKMLGCLFHEVGDESGAYSCGNFYYLRNK